MAIGNKADFEKLIKDLESKYYFGTYISPRHFAEEYLLENLDLESTGNYIQQNIDWGGVIEDLRHEFIFVDNSYGTLVFKRYNKKGIQ